MIFKSIFHLLYLNQNLSIKFIIFNQSSLIKLNYL